MLMAGILVDKLIVPHNGTEHALQNVTRKGAAMFPKLDIASVMPSPVDLMLVGNVSAVIRLNKEKATVFESLLSPIKNN